MKRILTLFIISYHMLLSNAITVETTPSRTDWNKYFHLRLEHIQTKLYNLALEGKIKAYMTDSLKSLYSSEHLKYRGSNKYSKYLMGIDDYPDSPLQLFSPKNIQCIWFIQKTNTSFFEVNQQTSLTGIALIYQPVRRMGLTRPHPLMNIAIKDLKTYLTTDEFSFLALLYYYSLHSNVLLEESAMASEDPFYYYNLFPTSQYVADSNLIENMVSMLTNSQLLIHERLQENPVEKIIFDDQTQKLISNTEFGTTYYIQRKYKIVTGVMNNTQVSKDTTYNEPLPLIEISAIGTENGKATCFLYNIGDATKTSIEFSIAFHTLKKYHIAIPNIWFFEDYFRWKLTP